MTRELEHREILICEFIVSSAGQVNLIGSIQLVTDDRGSQVSQVHTDLMLTSGVQIALHERVPWALLDNVDPRASGQAVSRLSDPHFYAERAGICGQGCVDQAAVWHPPSDGEVHLVCARGDGFTAFGGARFGLGASFDLHLEQPIGFGTLGEHEDAARFSIQSMNERKELVRALSLQGANHRVTVVARGRMNGHERWLVDHEQVLILVDGGEIAGRRCFIEGGAPQHDAVFTFDPLGGLEASSVPGKCGVFYDERGARAAGGAQLRGQESIEPHPVRLGWNADYPHDSVVGHRGGAGRGVVHGGPPSTSGADGMVQLLDFRADALIGEDLQEQRMHDAAVHDVHLFYAPVDGGERAFDLGDHAAGDHAAIDEGLSLARAERTDELAILVFYALDVGHQHEFGRGQGGGDFARCGVGVDVERLAIFGLGDGGDDRDVALVEQILQKLGTYAINHPDASQIGGNALPIFSHLHRRLATCRHQLRIFTAEPYRATAFFRDEAHNFRVDLAAQHHLDHIHGGVVGDAMTAAKGGLDAHLLQGATDLWATAVHDHHVDPHVTQQAHVPCERALETIINHRVTTVLDHEHPPLEALNVGESFMENGGFLNQIIHGGLPRSTSPAASLLAAVAATRWAWQLAVGGGGPCAQKAVETPNMNILLIAAQFAPYVTERPSAESVAQLAKALRLLEHTVTVVLPKTDHYQAAGLVAARRLSPLVAPSREGNAQVELAHVYDVTLTNGVRLGLLDLLARPSTSTHDTTDVAAHATWLAQWAQAVGAYVTAHASQGAPFDVVHAHDCEMGLALLSVKESGLPKILSVHDADQTGSFPRQMADIFGLTEEWLSSHDFGSGEEISLLKGLLSQADAVIVPSESYGKKLQAPEHRGGLARAFQAAEVIGIVEGVDQAVFNPATDSTLSCRYDAARPESKGRNRVAVLDRLALPFDSARPIVFSEWDDWGDSAWSTLLGALPSLLRNEMALVVAGGPAPSKEITDAFTDQFRYLPRLEPAERRGLLAASDFYLSVARKDPTGRRLMQASRYGSVPVAYLTDAVADLLVDCDAELITGNGIVFESMTQRALQTALARAIRAYNRPHFRALVSRVMRRDLAWDRAARRHAQVYSQLAHGA